MNKMEALRRASDDGLEIDLISQSVISKPKMEGRSMFLMLAPKSEKDKK